MYCLSIYSTYEYKQDSKSYLQRRQWRATHTANAEHKKKKEERVFASSFSHSIHCLLPVHKRHRCGKVTYHHIMKHLSSLLCSRTTFARRHGVGCGSTIMVGKSATTIPTTTSLRCLSSSSTTSAWERAAVRVKDTQSETSNLYMEAIRETHDPAMHLKTIEDELKGTIGKALGKQGQKIHYFVQLMQTSWEKYQHASSLPASECREQQQKEAVQQYNEYRKQALQARWELTVHRQAAGFIVNNHKYVQEHYPIAAALSLKEEEDDDDDKNENKEAAAAERPTKQFGDQLDWWQRVGRWR